MQQQAYKNLDTARTALRIFTYYVTQYESSRQKIAQCLMSTCAIQMFWNVQIMAESIKENVAPKKQAPISEASKNTSTEKDG